MTQITFEGMNINVAGSLIANGTRAPEFTMCKASDLSSYSLSEGKGKVRVLSVFPSLDTPVCQTQVRQFNQKAASISGVEVLCISKDLPFAASRFCTTANIDRVTVLSDFRNDSDFGNKYGLLITNSALRGLFARAVYVIDKAGIVQYSEIVSELTKEPDYEKAFAVAKDLV